MKIYIGHSSNFDYKEELYKPILNSELGQTHEIVFPHRESEEPANTRERMAMFDLMIAEVSYPSTGLGIELGWAHSSGVKIVCVYKDGTNPSSSLKTICDDIIRYADDKALIRLITEHSAQ